MVAMRLLKWLGQKWLGQKRAIAVCAGLAAALLSPAIATAQASAPLAQATDADLADAKAVATQLRDDYVASVAAAGLKCSIAPPAIRVEHVFSYGNYDEDTNTLSTSAWVLLTNEEKARFFRLAGPGSTPEMARHEFEIGVHHWVLSHEMGHWWQACQHEKNERHYEFELQANRLATAYWREHDGSVIEHQRSIFKYVLDRVPDPVPEGEAPTAYFDAHYPDHFRSEVDYVRFQARMCIEAFDEKPALSFAQVLRQVGPGH